MKVSIHNVTQKFFTDLTHLFKYDQIINLKVYDDNLKLNANHNVIEEKYYTLTFFIKGSISQGLSSKSYDIMIRERRC